jgi:hypothetical protein
MQNIIIERLSLRVSLTFNNIDVPHDIRVLQGKTLTNNTDIYFFCDAVNFLANKPAHLLMPL